MARRCGSERRASASLLLPCSTRRPPLHARLQDASLNCRATNYDTFRSLVPLLLDFSLFFPASACSRIAFPSLPTHVLGDRNDSTGAGSPDLAADSTALDLPIGFRRGPSLTTFSSSDRLREHLCLSNSPHSRALACYCRHTTLANRPDFSARPGRCSLG